MANIFTTGSNTQPNYSITGAAGSFTTTAGFNGVSYTTAAHNPAITISDNPTTLEVKGTMVINGKNLEERLDTIEKVLNIPERDVKLEKEYPKLKKMYDDYIKELSKARMWESLKGDEK